MAERDEEAAPDPPPGEGGRAVTGGQDSAAAVVPAGSGASAECGAAKDAPDVPRQVDVIATGSEASSPASHGAVPPLSGRHSRGPAFPDGITTPFEVPPEPGEAVEIAPGVLWLRLPLPMKLDHVNCYAFADADGWTLIDTGFDSRKTRGLWSAMLANGPLAGRPVARVVATHHHPDHIGLAGWFQSQGAALLTTRTAWLMARMLVLDEQDRPTPETLRFWRDAGMPPEMLVARADERPFNFADTVHPLPPGYTRLQEGSRLRFGGRDWVVHTGDGHAPEHATLWDVSGQLVIGGDQLLPGISPNLGVYPTEPEADPVAEWLASCTRLSAFATGAQLVLPGHKLPFRGLPARLRDLRQNHESALDRLEAALRQTPRHAAGCFDVLFKRRIGAGEFGLALVEAVAHLNNLSRGGRIRPVGRDENGAILWQATGCDNPSASG